MIRQCAILFGCLALGELVVFLTDIKLPSSIIGMLLLTLFLKLGWIKLQWVQGLSDFLVALALDTALALGKVSRSPRTVQVMKCHQTVLHIGACAHLGGAQMILNH